MVSARRASVHDQEGRAAQAFAVYLFLVAALVFSATALKTFGLTFAWSVVLRPAVDLIGCADTIWHAFWVSLVYFPLLLAPLLCYGVTRRPLWLVVQAVCAAAHVFWVTSFLGGRALFAG